MDATPTPRRLMLVAEPARATPDDTTASGAAPAAAPARPRVRRYRLARLDDGGAPPPSTPRRRR